MAPESFSQQFSTGSNEEWMPAVATTEAEGREEASTGVNIVKTRSNE